jgi:hypothetical protein
MGTITSRKLQDGTIGYTAQIRLKRGGKIIHTEAQTFDRELAAASSNHFDPIGADITGPPV